MKKAIIVAILFVIWLFFTWPFAPFDIQSFIAGFVAAALAVMIIPPVFNNVSTAKAAQPERYFWALVYAGLLALHLLKAGFETLYIMIHPGFPPRPGIVKIKTGLKSPLARAFLCNSITLAPGTLTVDISEDRIYVHKMHVGKDRIKMRTEKIGGKFERILKRIIE
ncbi:MAG: Na+/H+ antiporter subunit E [Elusimicrobiota bacterium]